MKVAIHWVTSDWRLIRRIREKYHLPQMMNINYLTHAEVSEETLEALRKGEPEYLIIRKVENDMEGTTRLNTLTNIVYILTDVLETNLMDMESAYRREGYGLRHDVKRQYNAAIHAIRRLKADINKCSAGEQESFGNDADMVNALLLTLLDRVGDDDMLAFKFFNYLKAFPSKLGLDLQVDGAFAHLFDNQNK